MTLTGRAPLVRLGFVDATRAQALLGPEGLGVWDPEAAAPAGAGAREVIDALAATADPDLALLSLVRLVEERPAGAELLQRLRTAPGLRQRLIAALGASAALGDHLVSHPAEWRILDDESSVAESPTVDALRDRLLAAVGAGPGDAQPRARGSGPAEVAALRTAYRRELLLLAARDLTGLLDLDNATAELSDLAAATLSAGLAVAHAGLRADAVPTRLAVIAMGKCGGHELNYVSDVDVVFVAEPAEGSDPVASLHTATTLATSLIRICGEVAWPVDAGLRPEGKAGPLVRTLDSHTAYYQRWARTWEFQALLKARPVAGDAGLGQAYVDRLAPLVWRAADRDHFVDDVHEMRRRVEATLPARTAVRELKLGPGGLRDVEFAVQLLQLVHGRADETLRSGTTLVALQALAAGGYVGLEDAETLGEMYRWLRTVEHRLQLQRLRRTHRLPDDEDGLRWLARAMGYQSGPEMTAVEAFEADRARHAREVRRLHEKLFYRPLLQSVARVPGDELRLAPAAAAARFKGLGFADPDGALRHLQALTAGVTRTAAIQRALLPAMLGAFAEAADPDAGLLAYRQVSEALGRTPWYLRFLRDEGLVAERLARLLASSKFVADLLARAPEALRMLASDEELRPRTAESLRVSMLAAAQRSPDKEAAVVTARGQRRLELLRVASADLLGLLDLAAVGAALSAVTDATLCAALDTAIVAATERRGGPLPMQMSVIAMGRLGGAEVGYSSDADVLFVFEPLDGAEEGEATPIAHEVAEEMRRLLAVPAPDPPLGVDAGLRPEGRQGPLVRSLASYAAYYARWSSIWETQALLRARPIAGNDETGARFTSMINRYRYPRGGISAKDVTEIRRIKARVDGERLPRGADPATHLKLGRGGLADVEWTVQLLQLRHAGEHAGLRTPGTLAALGAAAAADLLAADDAEALAAAWRLTSRVRNAVSLVRGRPADSLPRRGRELEGVARAVGYPPGEDPGGFVEEYLRTTRRARATVERVFYG
ncbi:MAG: bifunctional [glutamine synthetase] adenylyltransferase/[glutamine synthetase]-adenylyl-L-tyrosine phosphorylase [Pseudonocardiales bacterium]|nr:MAG: bifunctional [glutamine synthetase] adenylyltransferase/[glutamine synthetase]-adenylyl-L-tyrosine phosphorylase [Pseudonocardiales bacterium]